MDKVILYCGNCKYLEPKEREQTSKKEKHICKKYDKQVKHLGRHPELPRLLECDEPMNNYSAGTTTVYLTRKLEKETLQQIIEHGARACNEHRIPSISIYKARYEADVADGWDRYIVSISSVSFQYYRFVGIVRADGTSEIRFP